MKKVSTLIIAEMAWAHDGSVDKAISIMNAAKAAGADAIGIHVTDLPTYMVPHYGSGDGRVSAGKEHFKVYEYLNEINITNDQWIRFAHAARVAEIDLCVMPNESTSLQFCESYINPNYYVLTAAAFVEADFISAVAKTRRPTLFRIGGATLGEIEFALNLFRRNKGGKVTLLHGFQNYPTKLEETNILQMREISKLFDISVGLADHIDGSDLNSKAIPLLALALGASCIEKHITWDRSEKGEDYESALNPQDFKEFVSLIRAGETALGESSWSPLSAAAEQYRNVSRKRMVAARPIAVGTKLSRDDIAFKRADEGVSPVELDYVIGRTLTTNLSKNDGLLYRDML